MRDYNAYLFDWDGTLCASCAVWMDIFREVIAPYNTGWTDHELVVKVFGRVKEGLRDAGVPEAALDTTVAATARTAHKRLPGASLYPGVVEVLQTLKAHGKRLAIITATHRPTIEKLLAMHDLQGVFDVLVTGDEVAAHKPNPASLLFACRELDVSVHQTLMLGDSDKDLGAARNAGMDSLLFYPSENESFHDLAALETFNPTYTIHSWPEFRAELLK